MCTFSFPHAKSDINEEGEFKVFYGKISILQIIVFSFDLFNFKLMQTA